MFSFLTSKRYKRRVFEHCLSVLNEIPNINNGGCLIACWAIYKYLRKKNALPKDFKIVSLNTEDYEHHHVQNVDYVKKRVGVPTSSYHFVVKFDGEYYDSRGKVDVDYSLVLEIPATIDFCKKAYFYGGWNSQYNKVNNKTIEKNLGISFI